MTNSQIQKSVKLFLTASTVLVFYFFIGGFFISVHAQTVPGTQPAPETVGYTEGSGTHFQINNSEYLNITLDSSEPVQLTLESVPNMVTITTGSDPAVPATELSISGFLPLTTYYKYQDGYHDLVEFTTDNNGNYSYTQDLSQPHVTFIQTRRSTRFIKDNLTGGSCWLIGTWDWSTKTCTLTQDVFETIQIDSDGITLDGDDFAVNGGSTGSGIYLFGRTGVTIKNVTIARFTDGISMFNTNNSVIENVTATNNYTGLNIRSANNNVVKSNTLSGNSTGIFLGWYLAPDKSLNNQIYNNNFISGSHSPFILGPSAGTLFSYPAPIGGNYWDGYDRPAEGCIDANNDFLCDAPYTFASPGGTDPLPWRAENGWSQIVVPDEYFVALSGSSTGITEIHMEPSSPSVVTKTLPNDWVVKVFPGSVTSDGWVKIKDPTDGSDGWIQRGLDSLAYTAATQDELRAKSETKLDTKLLRGTVIQEAVHHYMTNTDTAKSLYSGDDTVNLPLLAQIGFPEELILAIAAQESGGAHDLNNEIVSFDYGHGVMQITFQAWAYEPNDFLKNGWDNRGIYSKVLAPVCRNIILDQNTGRVKEGTDEYKKCYQNTGTKNTLTKPYDFYEHNSTNQKYKQYTNTKQSIYANIKDALGVLRKDKFRKKCPQANVTIAGTVFTCSDIEKIIMVWGYNGWTQDPSVNYLRAVAGQLANLSEDFPGVSYANTDHLVEKMRIANNNRKTVWVHSPVELSMIDNLGNKTGVQNGITYEDIPNSAYFDQGETATVFFPTGDPVYRVIGTETGTYGITIESAEGGDPIVFEGTNLPITPGEVHTYTLDHAVLAGGGNGVTVQIDVEGDGVTDRTITTGQSLDDITPPVIIIDPVATEYILGQEISFSIHASDNKDGSVLTHTTLNGATIDPNLPVTLNKPGSNTLKITARDATGNESTREVTFRVVYHFDGFKPPIQNDGSGVYKLKSTIPIKFKLLDAYRKNPPASTAALTLQKIPQSTPSDDDIDEENTFRYDTKSGQYIFNLSTKELSAGMWQLQVLLTDGTTHPVTISLKS